MHQKLAVSEFHALCNREFSFPLHSHFQKYFYSPATWVLFYVVFCFWFISTRTSLIYFHPSA